MHSLGPILVAPLLRTVDQQLLNLLRSLAPTEWDLPTIVPQWRVRDVAAHLLDTATRKLTLVRDRCFVEQIQIRSTQDLTDLVNRLNREGVLVYRRLSPAVLITMLEAIYPQFADFHEALDPLAPAAFAVSWAGESESLNWFDTARELTERWHHQQQVRLAANRPGIQVRELYHPVLDCCLRALPYQFRDCAAAEGTVVRVEITGVCGGVWNLLRIAERWQLVTDTNAAPAARVVIPEEFAWRLFTKGLPVAAARRVCGTEGEPALAAKVLELTSIVG